MKNKNIQEQTKDFYNKYNYPNGGRGRKEYWKNKITCFFNPELLKDIKLLDVGCGNGLITNVYSDLGSRVYAIDQSLTSVRETKRKYPQLIVKQGDALKIPFDDNTFDIVTSIGVLHHTPKPYSGFSECVRVTKEGGFVLVALYNKKGWYNFAYNFARIFTKNMNPDNIPKFLLLFPKLFLTWYFKESVTWKDTRNLVADQFYTPKASFHTKEEVEGWGKKNNLEFKKYNKHYFGQHMLLLFRKNKSTQDETKKNIIIGYMKDKCEAKAEEMIEDEDQKES